MVTFFSKLISLHIITILSLKVHHFHILRKLEVRNSSNNPPSLQLSDVISVALKTVTHHLSKPPCSVSLYQNTARMEILSYDYPPTLRRNYKNPSVGVYIILVTRLSGSKGFLGALSMHLPASYRSAV